MSTESKDSKSLIRLASYEVACGVITRHRENLQQDQLVESAKCKDRESEIRAVVRQS